MGSAGPDNACDNTNIKQNSFLKSVVDVPNLSKKKKSEAEC